MKVNSQSLEETKKIAKGFVNTLELNPKSATIIGLVGDLGSGKTTFTQYLAEILGIKEYVTSPTFVIEKIYKIDSIVQAENLKNLEYLIHIDAYRLENSSDLSKLEWNETVNNRENLILIEWPEKVADILPKNIKTINFKFIDENTREIKYNG